MPSDELPDVDLQICMGIMRLRELEYDKISMERLVALIQLGARIKHYQNEFCNNPLTLEICAKKIDFILQAATKADLNEILSPPKVRYNFSEVVPVGKFHIEEEELLVWSLTSIWCGGPLNDAGFKRYMKLFNKYYPEMAKEIDVENTHTIAV
jgi:hypothetical protein